MASVGIVTHHLLNLLSKQVEEYGIVVWYDPDRHYSDVVPDLQMPDTEVMQCEGSFIHLRWLIDQKKLMDGEEPPRLVIYVPLPQDQTHHALIEFEAAGVVMQPGQQPPSRNTRLALVARNALREIVGDDTAVQIEQQTETGKLSLADLDKIADKGGEIAKGVISLIFGTGNPQEVVLSFLSSDIHDDEITKKAARDEFGALLKREFEFDVAGIRGLKKLRKELSRHILMTEFISGLGDSLPSKLDSVKIAPSPLATEACISLARSWRLRRDTRDSYVSSAEQIESEFALSNITFDSNVIVNIETFPCIEWALLSNAEERLLEQTDGSIVTLAESRLTRFWCEVEPRLQGRWALIASAGEVLLEAERVENALKNPPDTISVMTEEYTGGLQPWCLLDTRHRHMESRWYKFEAHGDDHERIERLVIKARQRYVTVGSILAKRFVELLKDKADSPGIPHQRESFERHVKPLLGKKKTAYIWVDSFRFEMARELSRVLEGDFDLNLSPAFASVPTITEIGMASLLPRSQEGEKIVSAGGGKLALEVAGNPVKDRRARIKLLKQTVGESFFDTKLDNLLPKPSKKIREGIAEASLLLVTSQEIDELCEQDNITQAHRQMDGVLNDLRRGIHVLVDHGVEQIILVADHGHIFIDELSDDMKIDPPGGETIDLHRRVWIGLGGGVDDAYFRAPLSRFGIDSEYDIATPWTFACFKSRGGSRAYFHGGLSPQEILIPIMTLKPVRRAMTGPPAGIEWNLLLGSEKLSTRFISVQVSGVNTGLFDITPPKARIEIRARGKVISRSVSASYGFDEATGDVAMRPSQEDPKVLESNTVTLMISEQPDQKSVALYLLDASTGVEMARLDKIEVAIGM